VNCGARENTLGCITSSQENQWRCETNIIFKALSCGTVPHFTTLANFVSGYSDEIEILFEQVLLVCDEQGLLGKQLFALDGCKMSSNAAKEWSLRASCPLATFVHPCTASGTFKELENKHGKIQRQIQHHIMEHKKLDKNESRDDERRVRSEKAIETLTKAHEKVDTFLKQASPGSIFAPAKSTFPTSMSVMGQGRIVKEVKSNITDNESAKMTTNKGTIQGYNGIATVDKKHQIIVDAQAFDESQEHHTLQPVLNSVFERFNRLGIKLDDPIITADTGNHQGHR